MGFHGLRHRCEQIQRHLEAGGQAQQATIIAAALAEDLPKEAWLARMRGALRGTLTLNNPRWEDAALRLHVYRAIFDINGMISLPDMPTPVDSGQISE